MSEPQIKHDRLEMAVIGAFLMHSDNIEKLREFVRLYGLKSEHFTDSVMRTAFDTIMSLKTNDQTTIYTNLVRKITQQTVDWLFTQAGGILLDSELHIKDLAEKGQKTKINEIIAKTFRECEGNSSPMAIWSLIKRRVEEGVDFSAAFVDDGISLAEMVSPPSEEEDLDCLFKGRFLRKGGALLLAAQSGVGKSVIATQLAYAWGRGKSAFGIVPTRPLSIGVFQTEDDDVVLGENRDAMRVAYKRFEKWSDKDFEEVEKKVIFYNPKGCMGRRFIDYVCERQLIHHFDLIIINPLQGVTDFDIAQNDKLSEFLRKDLDGLIKHDKNTMCGVMIVHHTNKPQLQNNGRYGMNEYGMQYIGAGGAELSNWMRSMLAITNAKESGTFRLVAAKGGHRLNWPSLSGKDKNPTRIIRQSTQEEGTIFWHEVTTKSAPSASKPREDDKETWRKKVVQELTEKAYTFTEARNLAKKHLGAKRGNAFFDELTSNPEKFGLVVKPTGGHNTKLIGTQEGVEKLIKSN